MSKKSRLGGLFSDRENPSRYERFRPSHETTVSDRAQEDAGEIRRPVAPVRTPAAAPAPPEAAGEWRRGAHYTVVLYAPVDPLDMRSIGRSPVCGHYQLWGRAEQSYRGKLVHADSPTSEEAEYRILIHALTDIVERIRRGGADPMRFRVDIYSRCPPVIIQLRGHRLPTSVLLGPLHLQARELLGRFGRAAVIPAREGAIERLMRG